MESRTRGLAVQQRRQRAQREAARLRLFLRDAREPLAADARDVLVAERGIAHDVRVKRRATVSACDDNALSSTLDVSSPEPALICAPSRSSRRAISSESSVFVPSSSIAIVNADVPGLRP